MKPEKQNLIEYLLTDESRRETILAAGGQILRRRRRWRAVRHGLSVVLLLTMTGTGLWLVEDKSSRTYFQTSKRSAVSPQTTVQTRSLTDDELLSLFPKTPVGLITLPNGKKLLIFPRPGDEEKFITRI